MEVKGEIDSWGESSETARDYTFMVSVVARLTRFQRCSRSPGCQRKAAWKCQSSGRICHQLGVICPFKIRAYFSVPPNENLKSKVSCCQPATDIWRCIADCSRSERLLVWDKWSSVSVEPHRPVISFPGEETKGSTDDFYTSAGRKRVCVVGLLNRCCSQHLL